MARKIHYSIIFLFLFHSIGLCGNGAVWYSKAVAAKDAKTKIAYLTKAIKADPVYVDAYYNRAIAYSELNRDKEAVADFSKVIKLKPEKFAAYYNRGAIHLKSKRYKDAASDFNKVIGAKRDYGMAYLKLGLAYEGLKRNKDAVTALKEYLRIDGNKSGLADEVGKKIETLSGK